MTSPLNPKHLVEVASIAVVVLVAACSPKARLQELAHPHVECQRHDLQISDIQGANNSANYLAICPGGVEYRCVSMGGPLGQEPVTTCERIGGVSPPQEQVGAGATAASSVSSWSRIEMTHCPASAELPEGGELRSGEMPDAPKSSWLTVSSFEDRAFTFACAEIVLSEGHTIADALEGSIQGMADSTGGTITSRRSLDGREGFTVSVRLPDSAGTLLGQVFVEGNWLYVGTAGPRKNVSNQDILRFFNGIRVEGTLDE